MLRSLFLQIISLARYHKRYMLLQIMSYAIISFILISAARITWVYAEIANFEQTNVYKIDIQDDVNLQDLNKAIESFISNSDPRDIVQVFAPERNNGSIVVGTNGIADAFWVWDRRESELISTNEAYVWMGSGFWQDHDSYRFPYESITINNEDYEVAGVLDMLMYCDREDISDSSNYGIYLPLQKYLESEYPIDAIALRMFDAPDDSKHEMIEATFSPFAEKDILPLQSISIAGFGTFMASICVPMILICIFLLGKQTRYYCWQRSKIIWVESALGATSRHIFVEFFVQTLCFSIIGWILARYPSDVIYYYANYDRTFPIMGWIFTGLIYMGSVWITHSIAICSVIRNVLHRQELIHT